MNIINNININNHTNKYNNNNHNMITKPILCHVKASLVTQRTFLW